ncbi:hypothetical protein C8T65DRAFT_801401 [Cerioporus squamosus]|nr:hypothetical protein C8T65DRAFT_801401 [Cerioporus squamosus]
MFIDLALYYLARLQQRILGLTEVEDQSREDESSDLDVEEPAPGSLNRTIKDLDSDSAQQEVPVAAKRIRGHDDLDDFGFDPCTTNPALPSPAGTLVLPPPSNVVIQLRFQLCRFDGVYRVARIPLSFTFAHLYRFMLLIFGWSGGHLHQAQVVTHAELYSPDGPRKGEVKKHRSFRIPEEPAYEDRQQWRHWSLTYARHEHDPVIRVTPAGSRKKPTPSNPNDPWEVLFSQLEVPMKKDAEVTLGDVWAPKRRNNVGMGDCSNRKIAIVFEYDFGASWEVHVTVEPEMNGEYMWKVDTPRNHPVITVAKGGPPVEDSYDDSGEIDAEMKPVSPLLFTETIFEKFLAGAVYSVAREKELAIVETDAEEGRKLPSNEDNGQSGMVSTTVITTGKCGSPSLKGEDHREDDSE